VRVAEQSYLELSKVVFDKMSDILEYSCQYYKAQ
jgi:hypothetical protein